MKVKELIKQLIDADPTGETECCVGNVDIIYVDRVGAYYDGSLQVLKRDANGNITGGEYRRSGDKINIVTLEISDLLKEPTFIIDYYDVGPDLEQKYKLADNRTREQWNQIHNELEQSLFVEWAKKRSALLAGNNSGVALNAKEYFKKSGMSHNTPFLKEKTQDELDGKCVYDSYNNKRFFQWDLTIDLVFDGMDWIFSKK
jgi:hypothetical protein